MRQTVAAMVSSIANGLQLLPMLVLLIAQPAHSQLHTLDVSQYLRTSWTAQDGYFKGIAGQMAQTADGDIWILSSNGLLHFDGARFVEWTPPAGGSLPGKPPSALLASRNGSLWLAGHGLAELRNNGTWHRYHELDSASLVNLAEDKDGVVWAAVGDRSGPDSCSLFRILHETAECYKRPELAGLDLTTLYADEAGRLWASSKIGIWKILPGPPRLIQNTPSVDAFCEDSDGSLLYTSSGPVWKLSNESRSENYLGKVEGNRINGWAMLRDRDGSLWIGTSGEGIVHLHEGRVDHFSSFDGLSSDDVNGLFQDREGNVWVMSPDGIDKFMKPAVPRMTRKQGLSSDSVTSVLIDRRGETWIGTDNGLNELANWHLVQPSAQFRNRFAAALLQTHTGRLLIAPLDGNKTIASGHGRIVHDGNYRSWLEGYRRVFALVEDRRGTLWAVSRELGLLHLDENGNLIKAFNTGHFGDYPLSVAFDPKRDGVWFTTHQGELLFLKGDKILERYGAPNGLGYGPVRVSEVDEDGGIWITTKIGLAHLKDGKISLLGRKNGLPCDALHWMRRDQDHNVWLYTECGLVSFTEDDLTSWIKQPSHTVTITHYLDNTEGVESNANGGWFTPLTALTQDGRILFAMQTGLGVLDPRHLEQNLLPPPVHIEGISADGHQIDKSRRASLPAKTSTIHITYTAFSFVAPRKVRFRYKLQGYDKDWSPPVSLRDATYTNLPPGNYSFKVIACNNDGIWNELGATLDFAVLPAWYQTLWFWITSAIFLLGMAFALYLVRIRSLERHIHLRFAERASERMRIAREMHDTLIQALQGLILSFSNYATQSSAPPEAQRNMERSIELADQLLASGRDRIRDLRGEPQEPESLLQRIDTIIESLFESLRTRVRLVVDEEQRQLKAIAEEEILQITREALTNAARHSGANAIQVRVSFERNRLRVIIEDNGLGMDATESVARRDGHFGLVGMRERAEVIGGRLTIRSALGQGTAIELSVPAGTAYKQKRRWFSKPEDVE